MGRENIANHMHLVDSASHWKIRAILHMVIFPLYPGAVPTQVLEKMPIAAAVSGECRP